MSAALWKVCFRRNEWREYHCCLQQSGGVRIVACLNNPIETVLQ
jgi:hypothetical protein